MLDFFSFPPFLATFQWWEASTWTGSQSIGECRVQSNHLPILSRNSAGRFLHLDSFTTFGIRGDFSGDGASVQVTFPNCSRFWDPLFPVFDQRPKSPIEKKMWDLTFYKQLKSWPVPQQSASGPLCPFLKSASTSLRLGDGWKFWTGNDWEVDSTIKTVCQDSLW